MTCTESKRLMLMRKEELSREQSDKLRLHVKSCSNCAAYMQETKDVTRGMETLRSFEPVLKNPEALMSDILNAVEKARRNRADVTVGFSGRMFAFLSRRAVRVAYGMFVLGSVGMFLAQQLTVAADVQLLEDKMAAVKALKEIGYSGTVTFEIFSRDRSYLKASREKFAAMMGDKAD